MKTRLFHVMLVLVGIALVGLPVAQAYFADVQLGSAISLGLVLSLAYATVVRVSNIWADGISNMRRTFAIIGTIAGIAGPIVAAMATSLPNGSKGAIAAGFIAALLASWKAAFGNAGAASPVDPKAGVLLALVLAMLRQDQFWIANAIFLGGLAGALVSSITKIAAYHGPFQTW